MKKLIIFSILFFTITLSTLAQQAVIAGKVLNEKDGKPIEFASILLKESGLWAITNEKGAFTITKVPRGKSTLTVQCLGYATKSTMISVDNNRIDLVVKMKEDNLKLDEIEVVAKRKGDEATTSYIIDRMALDNQQIINIGDIATLLPGGKTINSSLMNDNRIMLRANANEMGNSSFGTAIEVDGVRLDNNATLGSTLGASTRSVSSSNVESVEIVTGIPSVEYGDLSNGVVKVSTRKGKSPFIVEGKLNQHTRQVALHKGFDLGNSNGMLNISLEHARSFSDAASPFTAYQRNNFSLNYMNVFMRERFPLTLNAGISGNVGGYNSKNDPDQELDDYTKQRDNNWRGQLSLDWLLNKTWITNLSLKASIDYKDRKSEVYENTSSAATQAAIHSKENGYFVATEYDANPNADIILGPTGYWYEKSFNDSRALSYSVKMKADWSRQFSIFRNKLLLGIDFTGSKNYGRGTYYEDMRLAPSWREYKYIDLPALNNVALYGEEKIGVKTGKRSGFELTAGLRSDFTFISGSDYGTASSLSPRINTRYIFWKGRESWIRSLSAHAGWGKSVKLPSFQVLYPSPSYADRLIFTPGSTVDNKAFYGYHTHVSSALYNPDLKWQSTHQTDVGVEMDVLGNRITISGFYNKTFHPYMATVSYSPYKYKFTSQRALEHLSIPSANRQYTIDQQTGIVTVTDKTGVQQPVQLDYTERQAYYSNMKYVNGTPLERYGVEWIFDFRQIKSLRTSIRVDGNFYYYKGRNEMLFADIPSSVNGIVMSNGQPYQYIAYYKGANATSTSYSAHAAIANGAISHEANINTTITTHIPKIRMVVALRIEASLYEYSRSISEYSDGSRAYVLEKRGDYFGTPYDRSLRDKYLVVYPEYYSTWENPDKLIPFLEKFKWAKENNRALYNDLARMVVRSNYAYVMNPNRRSGYFSANLSITKEIGDHVTLSFYANNFFNNMAKVRSSQTDLETTLFGSGYIPRFYYGLSLKLKL